MIYSVPQTWPEYAEPTAEDLLGWIKALPDHEAVQVIERLQSSAAVARQCFQSDHQGLYEYTQQQTATVHGLLDKVAALNDVIVRAYRECTCGQTKISAQAVVTPCAGCGAT